jgi:iron complex outermembrane receptor protein
MGRTEVLTDLRSCRCVSQIAVFALMLLLGGTAAMASPKSFSIDSQDAPHSLLEFGRQSGLQILFASDKVKGITTNAVYGSYEPIDALHLLLKGTPLTVSEKSEGVLVVGPQLKARNSLSAEPVAGNTDGSTARLAQATAAASQPQSGADSVSKNGAASSSSVSSGSESLKLSEIIVTAQKVSQKLMDVPMSITVVTGDQLEELQATRILDWLALVPGLNINDGTTPGKGALILEGIPSLGAASEVGMYVNDTPVGSSSTFGSGGATVLDLLPYDLDRIEVLRGPQGTLYGASSMGGLVKYVMKSPDLDNFSASVGGDFFSIKGSDGRGDGVRGALNLPVVSGLLGLHVSAYDQYTPGFITNGLTGAKDQNGIRQTGGRAALLWDINSDACILVSALYQKVAAANQTEVALNQATGLPIYGDFAEDNVRQEPSTQEVRLYDLTLNWNLHWADLTSVSSYQNFQDNLTGDATASLAPFNALLGAFHLPTFAQADTNIDLGLEKFTQEVRLASPQDQPLRWLVGGFFTHEETTNEDAFNVYDAAGVPVAALNPFITNDLRATYKEYAGFGDLTYQITNRFDVTGGVRYAHNSQSYQSQSGSFIGAVFDTPSPPSSGRSSEGVTTFLFSPNYHFNETTIAYLRVATGYQPGGANVLSPFFPTAPATFSSSRLIDYQPGLKSTFLDGRASVDVSAFYIDWTKIQLLVEGPSDLANAEENGGKARSTGFDFAGSYTLIPGLVLGTNFNYTDAILTSPVASLNSLSGAPLPYVPRWSGALTAEYNTLLPGANWRTFAGGSYHYVGPRFSGVEGATVTQQLLQPADAEVRSYSTIDLHLGASHGGLRVSLYARNLTDKYAYLAPTFYRYSANPLYIPIDIQAPVLQPRTIGISVDQTF